MEFYEVINLIISALTLAIGLFGVIFGLTQYTNSKKVSKSQFVSDLIQKIRNDKDVKDVIRLIEHDDFTYDSCFYANRDLEYKTDKTLTLFSYLVYIKDNRIISEEEFLFFVYEIKLLLQNKQLQNYLYNVYHFSKCCKTECPFTPIIEYGKSNKILSEDFFDVDACESSARYKKIISF